MKTKILLILFIVVGIGCSNKETVVENIVAPKPEYEISQYVHYINDNTFYLSTYAWVGGKIGYSTYTNYVHIDSLSKVKTRDSLLVVKVMGILKQKGLKF